MRILYLDASFDRPFLATDKDFIELESSNVMAEIVQSLGAFDVIACGQGPGSYTGLRVALALASSLSLSWQAPLVMVSALYGLVPEREGSFYAMLDARSGGVYALEGVCFGGKVTFGGAPEKLSHLTSKKDYIVSPNIAPLKARLGDQEQFIEKMPDFRYILPLIEKKLHKREYSLEGQGQLLYLGKPACI